MSATKENGIVYLDKADMLRKGIEKTFPDDTPTRLELIAMTNLYATLANVSFTKALLERKTI